MYSAAPKTHANAMVNVQSRVPDADIEYPAREDDATIVSPSMTNTGRGGWASSATVLICVISIIWFSDPSNSDFSAGVIRCDASTDSVSYTHLRAHETP